MILKKIKTGSLLFILITLLVVEGDAQGPPNVLVILTDDQGWGDLSLSGNTNLNTPNIDKLAKNGALLEKFYVSPVCAPTRAEFLTGRIHTRLGVSGTSTGRERFSSSEETIGDLFKAEGYATGIFGKWHSGRQWPYHPNARGFDQFYGFSSGHLGHYYDSMLEFNGRQIRGKGYAADDFTNRAIKFIEENQDEPFFCFLSFNTPHSPMQVPDEFWERHSDSPIAMRSRFRKKENLSHTRAALAMLENIDWNVGRLMKRLESLEIVEDTIVVYFSDNGPNGWRWNDKMKGKKGSLDEGGVRVPCIVHWSRTIRPGLVVSQITGVIDLLPTLADFSGIDIDFEKYDGISLMPLLLETGVPWSSRLYFSTWKGAVSVRSQRFRLSPDGALFDMVLDPNQSTDVADVYPGVVSLMKAAIPKFITTPELDSSNWPIPIGHPLGSLTVLPADEGQLIGQLQRSNRFPNDSFITHWTRESDFVEWDVEVLKKGAYSITINYTCESGSVGATAEVTYRDQKVSSKILKPHNPPLVGATLDRIKRKESYVKDFMSLNLGTINLIPSRGSIQLRVKGFKNNNAIDLRSIVLEREELVDSRTLPFNGLSSQP
jgi:arylsulfatase A-like enzyme